MDHVAIMNTKLGLIDKVLSGEKKIESRWYASRRAPWNRVNKGDTIYFKDSGGLVRARATVSRVAQFEHLDKAKITDILTRYGNDIALTTPGYTPWYDKKQYCILMHLTQPGPVPPFQIDKTGFGAGAAWITIPSIAAIRKV